MRIWILCLALASVGVITTEPVDSLMAGNPPPTIYLGPADLTLRAATESCGTLLLNADGDYEASFGWQYGGVQAPYYGAFAECYSGSGAVCAGVFDFTTGTPRPRTLDAYVWEDAGGKPGAVLCVVSDVDPGPIGPWPTASRHSVPFPVGCCVEGVWWIGYWPNWPGGQAGWATTADLSDSEGCPVTNIAPGIGYPTGWQNVSTVWGPHNALGIGAEIIPCEPTPVETTTWGAIKSLYSAR